MHSEQEDTLKLQQGGAANERKNNMAEVFQEDGEKPEEESGKRVKFLPVFQVLKINHMCKKDTGNIFPKAPRSNVQNRRLQKLRGKNIQQKHHLRANQKENNFPISAFLEDRSKRHELETDVRTEILKPRTSSEEAVTRTDKDVAGEVKNSGGKGTEFRNIPF